MNKWLEKQKKVPKIWRELIETNQNKPCGVIINTEGCGIADTPIEKSADVIKLVAPSYIKDPRVEIINADIFEFKPTEKYDCAWFDIWDNISGDQYPEMKKLHRKFGHYVGWSDSWCRKQAKNLYAETWN